MVKALFYNHFAIVAGDRVEPHRGAVEERQDGAHVLVGRLDAIEDIGDSVFFFVFLLLQNGAALSDKIRLTYWF